MSTNLYDLHTHHFPKMIWGSLQWATGEFNTHTFYLPLLSPQKLVYQAAGMLITKLSIEFGSELLDSQGKN